MKLLSGFDFTFQPSIKREQIESLYELGFVERKENVVFLGPPGVGKTHLCRRRPQIATLETSSLAHVS